MASIIERNGHFCVVYYYFNDQGQKKQKWETFQSAAEAKRRKKQLDLEISSVKLEIPKCKILSELLDEYISIYGKNNWAISTYEGNVSIIENYIKPIIGSMKLNELTVRVIEKYYQQLLRTKAVKRKCFGNEANKNPGFVSSTTVKEVHKILRNCLNQAVKWELIDKNPCLYATVPKAQNQKREIWTAETLFKAIELCDDPRLKLAMNLSFSCSLRIGEMLGLTWDCIDISKDSIENGTAHVFINKELQRVSRTVLETLEQKDVITIFPSISNKTSTLQVLKTPKTLSSVRKVYLPKTVSSMLIDWKSRQEEEIEILGSEYKDFGLVFAGPFGMPIEGSVIRNAMKKLIKDNNLPPVVFHSLRHSSITYKLKLNGGDIKAVQGDSGHAQAQMVTDQYSHIIDEDRAQNAQLFEEAFYNQSTKANQYTNTTNIPAIDPDVLARALQSPELLALLNALGGKKE